MLPFKLRSNAGSTRGRKPRTTEDISGGGPVSKAITRDLQEFQKVVVTHLQGLQEEEEHTEKWKLGQAFQVFKQLFGKGKIALLHSLLPSIKCDQEAYAQAIYAACFECLCKSTKFLEKCVAAMTLYTLYETNPLLKAEDLKPKDYIPVGLNGFGIPRSIYRRAFRQRIRIDRANSIRLLHLGEECNMFADRCQEEHKLGPLLGVADDTVEILRRLSSCWDYCEYTGPVGLEALAGHADYPYRDNFQEASSTPVSPSDPGTLSIGEEDLETITSVLRDYESAVLSITFGTRKSKLSAELRAILIPPLPQEGGKSWPDRVEESNGLGKETPQSMVHTEGGEHDMSLTTNSVHGSNASQKSSNGSRIFPRTFPHHLVVQEMIAERSQKHLQNALDEVLERHGTGFIRNDGSFQPGPQVVAPSDMSTIGGVGAITVATALSGQGHAAVDTLLSSVHNAGRVPTRVEALVSDRVQILPTSAKDRFLFADLEYNSDNEEDSDSQVSNISRDSDLDDNQDIEFDEASAATSAVGQRALDMLLSKVSTQAGPKRAKVSGRTSRPLEIPSTPSHDDQSVASSFGAGERALGSLLQNDGSRKKLAKPTKVRLDWKRPSSPFEKKSQQKQRAQSKASDMAPPLPRHTHHEILEPDERSTASSIGVGNMALEELLKSAGKDSANTNSQLP